MRFGEAADMYLPPISERGRTANTGTSGHLQTSSGPVMVIADAGHARRSISGASLRLGTLDETPHGRPRVKLSEFHEALIDDYLDALLHLAFTEPKASA